MGAQHLQCTCGQLVFVSAEKSASGVRCPGCGATVRAGQKLPARRGDDGLDRRSAGEAGQNAPAADARESDTDGEYQIALEPRAENSSRDHVQGQPGTFYRSAGTSVPGETPSSRPTGTRKFGETTRLEERVRTHTSVDLPGPFFKFSALFYPWLHPNWVRWLGLTFMSWLAVTVVTVSWFVFRVIMDYGAFVSLFTVPAMAMACLALVSFVFANFIAIIEETAEGEDRFKRFADLNWWETLPRFMRTLGAATATTLATYGLTYPLSRWLMPDSVEFLVLRTIIAMQLFPIFLVTNLVDGSWIPFTSLIATLKRLAACVGCFTVFLLLTMPTMIGLNLLIVWFEDWHPAAAIAVLGPIAAAWLMFYGHWLGRLVRQLSAAD